MEYLSLILVLTFLALHNIILVVLGMLLAIYLLNKKHLDQFINKLNKLIFAYKKRKKESPLEVGLVNLNSNDKDVNMSLVEEIEETGIIPSIPKNRKDIAA